MKTFSSKLFFRALLITNAVGVLIPVLFLFNSSPAIPMNLSLLHLNLPLPQNGQTSLRFGQMALLLLTSRIL